MRKIRTNKMIETFNNTPWCIGCTRGSGPLRLGSIPNGVVFKEKNMEKETENLDSEPPAQRCCRVGFTYRETEYDFKDYSHRHCAISSEGEKSLC